MNWLYLSIVCFILGTIKTGSFNSNGDFRTEEKGESSQLAQDVVYETKRAWNAYRSYAWGHDNLKPLTKTYDDWYDEPLYISLIDAYSTLHIMGLQEECSEIEEYIINEVSFDKDIEAKVFEVNIRVLGGLLSMYDLCPDQRILDKAIDFGNRILPAFESPTGLPYYSVNLRTGEVNGNVLNVAEAGSYLIEMGMLSYFSGDPTYYQKAKKATLYVYNKRSSIDLLGRAIEIETGQWINPVSSIGCYSDSYYEYLIKGYSLFADEELKSVWDTLFSAIKQYHIDTESYGIWFGKVHMNNGSVAGTDITLWDAFFSGQLAAIGEIELAEESLNSWDYLWSKYQGVPMFYDYKIDATNNPYYQLNPEVIESTYYLWHYTREEVYLNRLKRYYSDIKEHCRTDMAYANLKSVITKEKDDKLPTFFFAETMKYFYLAFTNNQEFDLDHAVFTTEAHPFKKSSIDIQKISDHLGL